jgi:hypothetical protein
MQKEEIMFNCQHCWETPCCCGFEYRDWEPKRVQKQIDTLEHVLAMKRQQPELWGGKPYPDPDAFMAELRRRQKEAEDKDAACREYLKAFIDKMDLTVALRGIAEGLELDAMGFQRLFSKPKPGTMEAAIADYNNTPESAKDLIRRLTEKLIDLKCPHCHQAVGVEIPT